MCLNEERKLMFKLGGTHLSEMPSRNWCIHSSENPEICMVGEGVRTRMTEEPHLSASKKVSGGQCGILL